MSLLYSGLAQARPELLQLLWRETKAAVSLSHNSLFCLLLLIITDRIAEAAKKRQQQPSDADSTICSSSSTTDFSYMYR